MDRKTLDVNNSNGAKQTFARLTCKENPQTFCKGLQQAMTMNKRAIFTEQVMNINTGKTTGIMVVYKGGDYAGPGILLNFCPFCGKPVNQKWTKTKDKKDKKEEKPACSPG